ENRPGLHHRAMRWHRTHCARRTNRADLVSRYGLLEARRSFRGAVCARARVGPTRRPSKAPLPVARKGNRPRLRRAWPRARCATTAEPLWVGGRLAPPHPAWRPDRRWAGERGQPRSPFPAPRANVLAPERGGPTPGAPALRPRARAPSHTTRAVVHFGDETRR